MADGDRILSYQASRTGARFHASGAYVRGLMGPIGGGKSVTCVKELFRRARHQLPGPDGWRRTRWAIVRQTYPELKSTTIKTFQEWIPDAIAPIRWDVPITARMVLADEKVDAEFIFIAVERPDDAKKLLSLELTGAWVNEAREMSKKVIDDLIGRLERYPALKDGGPTWSGLLMDTNPPDTDHWWYRLAEVDMPKGWEFFRQPGALIRLPGGEYVPNPLAENITHLSGGYEQYQRKIQGKTEEWIKVYVLGEYGSSHDGKPVYTEYRDSVHCAGDPIEPMRGLPLYLGWDYGRTPALAICQLTPTGQFRVLEELVVDSDGPGMGIRQFTREVARPHLLANYPDMQWISRGDPSGVAKDGSDHSCFDIQGEEGIPTLPAITNDPTARQDAVRKYMMANVGDEPGFLVSPKAFVIRKGFLGGYKYRRMQVVGEERYRDVPDKNRYSHPHDALQYAALATNESGDKSSVHVKAQPRSAPRAAGWT